MHPARFRLQAVSPIATSNVRADASAPHRPSTASQCQAAAHSAVSAYAVSGTTPPDGAFNELEAALPRASGPRCTLYLNLIHFLIEPDSRHRARPP